METERDRHLLVVDDDPVMADMLMRRLKVEGYEAETAGRLGEALERIERGGIDFVLLDFELPDGTGVDGLKVIRKTQSAIELPVIMVTGHGESEITLESLREGANDYVTKPVDLPVLVARVETHMTLRNLHARVRESHRSLIHAARMESALHLAGGFAQEIRRPLVRVRAGLNRLKERFGKADEETQSTASGMDEALREADGVVSRLVASSQEHRLRLEPTDAARFCEEMMLVVRETATEAGVEMELKTVDELTSAMISAQELKQVFLNVALNAIRAGGKGSKVVVRVLNQRVPGSVDMEGSRMGGRLHPGDDAIAIEIEDAGPGVTGEELQRVFDPFFKGRCAGPGAGLGLTLARSLVELHGGLLTLDNRAFGSGVKVSIFLRPKPVMRV